jgi:hypothetical protein
MIPMYDQVRERTNSLRHTADGIRRERELHAAVASDHATDTTRATARHRESVVTASGAECDCLPVSTGQAA